VSCTLDFAYNDFCIAQLAHKVGNLEEAALFEQRAQNYRHLFDAETGFMRGRHTDGSWETPFKPLRWGGGYVEGSAWQHRFAVPHDIEGMMALLGGPQVLVEQLDALLSMPPAYEIGTYPYEIHEMTEMAAANFGQYAHSNQPVHHNLYLYAYAGQPHKTYQAVHRVLTEMYTLDTLPGDEDNGEMSAWYVLSSLGLYPTCPGKPVYTVTAPLHEQAQIHLPNGNTLEITAEAMTDAPLEISHERVLQGGHLVLPRL
jgi:predicted alpha-1,2-mannosidase